jgi:hypothetical protein
LQAAQAQAQAKTQAEAQVFKRANFSNAPTTLRYLSINFMSYIA